MEALPEFKRCPLSEREKETHPELKRSPLSEREKEALSGA